MFGKSVLCTMGFPELKLTRSQINVNRYRFTVYYRSQKETLFSICTKIRKLLMSSRKIQHIVNSKVELCLAHNNKKVRITLNCKSCL